MKALLKYNVAQSEKAITSALARNVTITNVVAIIFSVATAIIYLFILFNVPYLQRVSWVFVPLVVIFLSPIVFNRARLFTLSRVVLGCVPSLAILSFSIYTKLNVEDLTFNDFYSFRIGLVSFCTIPFLLFSLHEKYLLLVTSSICFLCLALTDWVHHLFNVGFYDVGFTDSHYDFVNFPTIVSGLSIMGGVLTLKQIIEKQERENNQLVLDLKSVNHEIATQRDELILQREKLNDSQAELKKANEVIQNQKQCLEEELVLYDHEITQFSYNVCHHLRGPVASMSGLVNILEIDFAQAPALVPHFKKNINHLESVVSDLSYVLGIRKDVFRSKTMLSIRTIVLDVQKLLDSDIKQANPLFTINTEKAKHLYASYAVMVNVLYNLIANAIKFRNESKQLIIDIASVHSIEKNRIELSVTDNGLGIDLARFGHDVFKMYKRFHLHKEGKGLGLYLVKTQVTAMGGSIKVDSVENNYTKFIMEFPFQG